MIRFDEFIGNILQDLARARLKADLETLRIAELHSGHPLLKHMPVPRFRIPDMKIDLPILLEEPGGTGVSELENETVLQLYEKNFYKIVNEFKFEIPANRSKSLNSQVERLLSKMLHSNPQPPNKRISDEIIVLIRNSKIEEDEDKLNKAMSFFRASFLNELNILRSATDGIKIIPTTNQIRSITEPDILPRLSLTISEEAVEWTVIENANGEEEERLVQE